MRGQTLNSLLIQQWLMGRWMRSGRLRYGSWRPPVPSEDWDFQADRCLFNGEPSELDVNESWQRMFEKWRKNQWEESDGGAIEWTDIRGEWEEEGLEQGCDEEIWQNMQVFESPNSGRRTLQLDYSWGALRIVQPSRHQQSFRRTRSYRFTTSKLVKEMLGLCESWDVSHLDNR